LNGIKEVEKTTGRKCVYVPNITCGDFDEMLHRAKIIESLGGNCLMIDVFAAGITAVQSIRNKFPKMILHGHRAGHGAQTIYPEPIIDGKKYEFRHGISMKAWTLLIRIAGIDQLHIGAPLGKMEADETAVLQNLEACFRPLGKIKTCRPICSGGLKATVMWDVAKIMNPKHDKLMQDFIFQAGGGTHAHELGTFGGAKSLAQARDSIAAGIGYKEAIPKYFETFLAFRKWEPEIYSQWIKDLTSKSTLVVEPDLRPYYAKGKELGKAPAAVNLQTAMTKYPPLKEDIKKFNPKLLK
jgi:ribulose 1,5-bisphosphate carboxylase large subunit-like protein